MIQLSCPGLLGNDKTKSMIVNLLSIINTKKRDFKQIQKILQQFTQLKSNPINLLMFIKVITNPEKENDILKQFISKFISEQNAKTFKAIFYTQSSIKSAYNLENMILKQLQATYQENHQDQPKIPEDALEKLKAQAVISAQAEYKECLADLLLNLPFSRQQNDTIFQTILMFLGNNDAWDTVYLKNLKIYSDNPSITPQMQETGKNFFQSLLVFFETSKKFRSYREIIKMGAKKFEKINIGQIISMLGQPGSQKKEGGEQSDENEKSNRFDFFLDQLEEFGKQGMSDVDRESLRFIYDDFCPFFNDSTANLDENKLRQLLFIINQEAIKQKEDIDQNVITVCSQTFRFLRNPKDSNLDNIIKIFKPEGLNPNNEKIYQLGRNFINDING